MKIVKQTAMTLAATSIVVANGIEPVYPNPAVLLAPAGLCAGTAGVGCILLGVAGVTATGVVIYKWLNKKTNKVYYVDVKEKPIASGTVLTEPENPIIDTYTAESIEGCRRLIKEIEKQYGGKWEFVTAYDIGISSPEGSPWPSTPRYRCIFRRVSK